MHIQTYIHMDPCISMEEMAKRTRTPWLQRQQQQQQQGQQLSAAVWSAGQLRGCPLIGLVKIFATLMKTVGRMPHDPWLKWHTKTTHTHTRIYTKNQSKRNIYIIIGHVYGYANSWISCLKFVLILLTQGYIMI